MTTATYQSTSNHPAARSQNDTLKALPTTLRSEWIKLSTIRSNKAVVALTIALNGLVSWAVAAFVTEQGELFVDEVFAFSTVFTAVFAAVAGILIFSSEDHHGSLAPTLTAQPARLVIATAKTLTALAFGAVLGISGLLAGLAGASIAGIETGDVSTIAETSAWAVLFVSLGTTIGRRSAPAACKISLASAREDVPISDGSHVHRGRDYRAACMVSKACDFAGTITASLQV